MIDFKELGFVTVNTRRKYLGLPPLTREEFDEEVELREKRQALHRRSRMQCAVWEIELDEQRYGDRPPGEI